MALRLACGTLLVAILVFVLGRVCAKRILFVEGGNKRADVIIILGGDAGERTFRALELYKAGAAPRIMISGNGDCFWIRDHLVLAGVSTNAIMVESNSHNTKENAQFSVRVINASGVQKAIVVTSWYHSRRALACFRHFGSGIEFSSFPAYNGMSMDHKPTLVELPNVVREYLGIGWYLVRYGIIPDSGISQALAKVKNNRTPCLIAFFLKDAFVILATPFP